MTNHSPSDWDHLVRSATGLQTQWSCLIPKDQGKSQCLAAHWAQEFTGPGHWLLDG